MQFQGPKTESQGVIDTPLSKEEKDERYGVLFKKLQTSVIDNGIVNRSRLFRKALGIEQAPGRKYIDDIAAFASEHNIDAVTMHRALRGMVADMDQTNWDRLSAPTANPADLAMLAIAAIEDVTLFQTRGTAAQQEGNSAWVNHPNVTSSNKETEARERADILLCKLSAADPASKTGESYAQTLSRREGMNRTILHRTVDYLAKTLSTKKWDYLLMLGNSPANLATIIEYEMRSASKADTILRAPPSERSEAVEENRHDALFRKLNVPDPDGPHGSTYIITLARHPRMDTTTLHDALWRIARTSEGGIYTYLTNPKTPPEQLATAVGIIMEDIAKTKTPGISR